MARLFPLVFLALLCALPAPATAQYLSSDTHFLGRWIVCETKGADLGPPDFDDPDCQEQIIYNINPQDRDIWLQTVIDSNTLPDLAGRPRGVAVSAMAATAIFWNGEALASNGMPAASRRDEVPGEMDFIAYLRADQILPGENVLTLHMSSHQGIIQARRPVHVIAITPYGSPRAAILAYYLPAIISAGALLLAALYFLIVFALNRRDTGPLLLGLMALFAIGQLGAESWRGLFSYPYTHHVVRLALVGIFATAFSVSMTAFIANRFAQSRQYLLVAGTLITILVLSPFAPGFDGKPLLALLVGSVFSLGALARPAWRGERGARLTSIALVGFIGLIVYQQADFLNRDFFLAVCALMAALFADQILTLRRERRAREAASRRSDQLELELLRRGIAPHFLMNTLNSLAEWVESDPPTGLRMIDALSEQMRSLAMISDRDMIPLDNEIELTRSYLTVMSYRTDTPFSLDIEGSTSGLQIPPGILHTLAENAFSHNHYPDGGVFQLVVEHGDDGLRLRFDTPVSTDRRDKQSGGTGHAYIRAKLAQAFGDRARFESAASTSGQWCSHIHYPAPAT
jgi:hypothetical protein